MPCMSSSFVPEGPRFEDLGRLAYDSALRAQEAAHAEVFASRSTLRPIVARVLYVEHPPVITVTRRPSASAHVLAGSGELQRLGVAVSPTDRGGDVTYHGPGQLVAYPIVDLNALKLNLHSYMRTLEEVVIRTLASFRVTGERAPGMTGVWVRTAQGQAKIAAMGVRVRQWISMHGLALNVAPDLAHFQLIVPCGLHGQRVTSMRELLGDACPTMDEVRTSMTTIFAELLRA